ncbi:Protein MAIN-LIKE 1 [Linum grandiflorum]
MTITLEDVAFITRLPVDGGVVVQEYPAKDYNWGPTIFRILGETPGKDDYAKDGRLKLTWLKRTFMHPSQISSSGELRWKQYARAYALACIGSFLFADRSGAAVHPVYLLLLEQERPSDTEYYAGGCVAGVAIQRDGALNFQLGGAREGIGRHRRLDGVATGMGVPYIAQRTHDERCRGPDGQEYPRLRRCGLEPNRTLF